MPSEQKNTTHAIDTVVTSRLARGGTARARAARRSGYPFLSLFLPCYTDQESVDKHMKLNIA
jgi:hypothetical protein